MLVYGEGGVGKTTFTSTAPKPILADCESGAKYFGLRGIKLDLAPIQQWSDMKEFLAIANTNKYETIIIDPIGELMEKLMTFMTAQANRKLVQADGNPTMAGWGWLKKTMRMYLKVLRDTGKHIIIVAHLKEKTDDNRLVKRPMLMTKLSEELVNLVDVVAYMTIIQDGDETKRVLLVDPTSDKFTAKDRTGQLGGIIPPNFKEIVNACQGTEKFKWSSKQAIEVADKKNEPKEKNEDEEIKKIEKQDIDFEKNDDLFKETQMLIVGLEDKEHKAQAIDKAINSNQFNSEQIIELEKMLK